jgi:3-hydroxyacyl-[acyl-carrier-protein] dehydratase
MIDENTLKETLKHCSQETFDASFAFNKKKDLSLVPVIVFGIIERYLESDNREVLYAHNGSIRLREDLGIDSLTMLEIVVTIEQTLQIKVGDESLMSFTTIGDIKSFIENYEQ